MKNLLKIPKIGIIGFHPAELLHNTGKIISQYEINIDYNDDATSLYDKVLSVAKKQVLNFTKQFEEGNIQYVCQSPEQGNT